VRRSIAIIGPILLLGIQTAAAQILPVPPPPRIVLPSEVVAADEKAADVGVLLSTFAERLGSSVQFAYGISDVADFRADAKATDIQNAFVRNPDDTLWKGTLTVKMASLFTSVADLHDAYTKLNDYKKTFGFTRVAADPLAGKSQARLLDYFTRTGSGDRFGRFMSAFTLSGSLLERAELDFGLAGPPAGADDRTKLSFDIVFDPSALFVTASQKKQAFDALSAYLKAYPSRARDLGAVAPCTRGTTACIDLRSLAGLGPLKALAATLIPTVKLESVDEFDYAMVGGQPILFPETAREGSLQTVTFTWDLLEIIKPSPARREAVAAGKAQEALDKLRLALATSPIIADTQVPALRSGLFVTFPLTSTWTELGDYSLTWQRTAKSVWTIEGLYVTADGLLVGAPRCPSGAAPCSGTIAVTAKDKIAERPFELLLKIEVVP
jgi:hypothetical protein